MSRLQTQFKQSGDVLISSPPYPSHSTSNNFQSGSKISPAILLIIIILAIIFFVSGILNLLVRFLMKIRPSFYSSVYHSNRYPQNPTNDTLQRQLQQLFRLHDSGLDQVLIDALPVFSYKDIMGLKEPFDCAVCLCEFSNQDNLRLLPMCSHAFHITCIDTWLLTNSTCPLCRGSLLSCGLENQEFSLDHWRELSFRCAIDGDNHASRNNIINNGQSFHHSKPTIMEENASERRVFSVRLGKFRTLNNGTEIKEHETSSCSSSNQLDARRCYSMGSCEYVVADMDLQVTLANENASNVGEKVEIKEEIGNCSVDMDVEGKKISKRNKGDSFSVSKIWLWSKRGKIHGSSEVNVQGGFSSSTVALPLSTTCI